MEFSRRAILLSLIAVVPAGFYSKMYNGPGAAWVNEHFDGVLYEIFWCLAVGWCFPRLKPQAIAAGVLVCTCTLEFLQLWHPAALEAIRAHFLGAVILGTTFDWMDFPYYLIGSMAGWAWLLMC